MQKVNKSYLILLLLLITVIQLWGQQAEYYKKAVEAYQEAANKTKCPDRARVLREYAQWNERMVQVLAGQLSSPGPKPTTPVPDCDGDMIGGGSQMNQSAILSDTVAGIKVNQQQPQIRQEQNAFSNFTNEMTGLASISVGSGEMSGEFILNGGYGLYSLTENNIIAKSSGSFYSIEAEYSNIKEFGCYTRLRAAYTTGMSDGLNPESDMNIDCLQLAYGFGFAGDGINSILEVEYYYFNLINYQQSRSNYIQNMIGFNIAPFYGVGVRDMESSVKIGINIEPLLTIKDTRFAMALGGYFEYKLNMLNIKCFYSYLYSTSESYPSISSFERYGITLGLRIPW